jgi:hypothetical protein
METKEELQKMANSLATQAVLLGGAHVKSLLKEIEKSSNIPKDDEVFKETFIYTSFFGLYILRRRYQRENSEIFTSDVVKESDSIFKEAFLSTIKSFFHSLADEKSFTDWLSASYDDISHAYSEHRGDVSNLLCETLIGVFNGDSSTSTIKFWTEEQFVDIERIIKKHTTSILPWKKLSKERTQELIQNSLHDRGIEFVLPISILSEFSKNMSEEFEKADLITLES